MWPPLQFWPSRSADHLPHDMNQQKAATLLLPRNMETCTSRGQCKSTQRRVISMISPKMHLITRLDPITVNRTHPLKYRYMYHGNLAHAKKLLHLEPLWFLVEKVSHCPKWQGAENHANTCYHCAGHKWSYKSSSLCQKHRLWWWTLRIAWTPVSTSWVSWKTWKPGILELTLETRKFWNNRRISGSMLECFGLCQNFGRSWREFAKNQNSIPRFVKSLVFEKERKNSLRDTLEILTTIPSCMMQVRPVPNIC